MDIYQEAIEKVREQAKITATKIKELEKNKGDYVAPINSDIIKTEKSMFYERTLEILRELKIKKENK
jgi:hypothetical protein